MAKLRKLRSRSGSLKRKNVFGNTKRKKASQKTRKNEPLLVFTMAFFLCFIGISYISQTNSIATRGYEVEQYESELGKLKNDNQNMKNRAAELMSMKNLEGEKGKLSAMAPSDINYVAAGNTAVAMRQ